MGSRLQEGLQKLQLQFPDKIDEVGMGLMLGIVLRNDGARPAPSMALVKSLHQEGMLTIPRHPRRPLFPHSISSPMKWMKTASFGTHISKH